MPWPSADWLPDRGACKPTRHTSSELLLVDEHAPRVKPAVSSATKARAAVEFRFIDKTRRHSTVECSNRWGKNLYHHDALGRFFHTQGKDPDHPSPKHYDDAATPFLRFDARPGHHSRLVRGGDRQFWLVRVLVIRTPRRRLAHQRVRYSSCPRPTSCRCILDRNSAATATQGDQGHGPGGNGSGTLSRVKRHEQELSMCESPCSCQLRLAIIWSCGSNPCNPRRAPDPSG